jgi:hypothetical protein
MIKRYVVFAGYYYYPSGGWSDFKDSFDTLEEAEEMALYFYSISKDWVQIIDLKSGKETYVEDPKEAEWT